MDGTKLLSIFWFNHEQPWIWFPPSSISPGENLNFRPGNPELQDIEQFADRSLRPSNPNMVKKYKDGEGNDRVTGAHPSRVARATRFSSLVLHSKLIHE